MVKFEMIWVLLKTLEGIAVNRGKRFKKKKKKKKKTFFVFEISLVCFL